MLTRIGCNTTHHFYCTRPDVVTTDENGLHFPINPAMISKRQANVSVEATNMLLSKPRHVLFTKSIATSEKYAAWPNRKTRRWLSLTNWLLPETIPKKASRSDQIAIPTCRMITRYIKVRPGKDNDVCARQRDQRGSLRGGS